MFVVILKYIKPVAEVDRVLPAHKEFLDKYYKSGNFILSGRQNPRTGGLIMSKASSREEIEAITKKDPFCTEGIAEYTFIEFDPTRCVPELEEYLG